MEVGKCICQEGYKPAKEDPIKCLNIGKTFFLLLLFFLLTSCFIISFFSEENECHTNLDCPHHIPCVNHFPILHTMNRALDDQLYFALKKECMPPYDPTIGGKQKKKKIVSDSFFSNFAQLTFSPPKFFSASKDFWVDGGVF